MEAAKRIDVKEAIAQAYMERAIKEGFDKIRVLEIAKDLGINKNSFYYHFATRKSVAYWIIRRDIAQILEEHFDPSQFVYVDPTVFANPKDAFEELPYYVRIPKGARMLDQGSFIKQIVLKLRENQSYYRTCFQEESLESTMSYLGRLFKPAMERDVDIIADGRYLTKASRQFLAIGLMNMNFGLIKDLACAPTLPDGIFDDSKNPFWNMAAESLNDALRNHPIYDARFLPEGYNLL